MAQPDSIALAAQALSRGLVSILVGGNAVNLHSYSRTTFDVDLLVREADVDRWLSFFKEHGYEVSHQSANFVRLQFAADPTAALPVDLMLVDEHTFRQIESESRSADLGNNLIVSIPSPLHLIAMKLHALRNPQRLESGVDLQDVKHLIAAAAIDTSSKEFIDLTERYATDAVRRRLFRELGQNPDQ